MVFQLRKQESREVNYPNAQDPDFLGYDRDNDRWKVDASGIHIYASGISVELDKDDDSVAVWSASGTPTLPVYLENDIRADIDLDKGTDSLSVWSASGTTDIPVYMTSPVEVQVDLGDSIKINSASGTPDIPIYTANPIDTIDSSKLVPKEYDYIELSYSGDNVTQAIYKVGGALGVQVAQLDLTYLGDNVATVTRT